MPPTWFNNRGQIIQVGAACVGCLIAAINAWPAIKALDFVSLWPIAFYAAVGLTAFSFTFRQQTPFSIPAPMSAPLATLKPSARSWNADGVTFTRFKLSLGQVWTQGEIKASLQDVKRNTVRPKSAMIPDSEYIAELDVTVGGNMLYCGLSARKLNSGRFTLPVTDSGFVAEPGSVYSFTYSETHIRLRFFVVEHVNWFTKEVDVVYCQSNVYYG